MNAVLVPLVARREKNRLEGEAARASGVDVEAPRLDCSADERHDIERPRERRNQRRLGIRHASQRERRCSATWPAALFLCRLQRVQRGDFLSETGTRSASSRWGQGGRSTSWLRSTRNLHFIPNPVEL